MNAARVIARKMQRNRRQQSGKKDFVVTLLGIVPVSALVTVGLYFNTEINKNATATADVNKQTALLMQMVHDQKLYFEQSSNDSKRERDQIETQLEHIQSLLEVPRGHSDSG